MKKIIATTLLAVVFAVANAGLRSVAWFFDCGDDDHLLPPLLRDPLPDVQSRHQERTPRPRRHPQLGILAQRPPPLSPLRLKELQVELPG